MIINQQFSFIFISLYILIIYNVHAKTNLFLPIDLQLITNGGVLTQVLKKGTSKLALDGVIINYNSIYKSKLVIYLTKYKDNPTNEQVFYFLAIPHPFEQCRTRMINSYIPSNLEYSIISHFAHVGYKNLHLFCPSTRIDIYYRLKYITMLYNMNLLNFNNKTLEYYTGMLDIIPPNSVLFVRYEDIDTINGIASDYSNKPNLLSKNILLVLPSIVDEYITHNDKDIYKNVYIWSGYFHSIEDEDNKKFISELNLNSDQYLTDSVYSSLMLLLFFKTIPLDIPLLSYEFILSNITNTCIKSPILSTDSICYISNNCLIRPFYLGKVNDNGDILVVTKLYTNYPSEPFDNFYSPPYQPCKTPFLISKAYGICYISNANSTVSNYHDILDGLFISINSINYNNLESFRYYLLVPNPFVSIKSQYDFCVSFSDVVAFVYYTHTNGSTPLLPYVNENNNLILTIGYDYGQFCHPNFFHIGTSTPTMLYFSGIMKNNEYTMIIASHTEYGRKSMIFSENYLKLKDHTVVSILIKDYNSKIELENVMKSISEFVNLHPSALLLCILYIYNYILIGYLGNPYIASFLKEYKNNILTKSLSNTLLIYDMTISDIPIDDDISKYSNINTIVTFNGSCFHNDSFCSNILSNAIIPTQFTYYGYLSMVLFNNFYISSDSFDIKKIIATQLATDLNIDGSYIYVNNQRRIKIKLHFVTTTDVKNELVILDSSKTSVSFEPWTGNFIEHTKVMCDFESPLTNYTRKYSTVTILNIASIRDTAEAMSQYAESLVPSNSTRRIIIITKSLNINDKNILEWLRNTINKYKPIAIIGGDTKEERELILPVIEEYKIPLFVINKWSGNECFKYVYHLGPSVHQLAVSILYSFITFYQNIFVIYKDDFINMSFDNFFNIMSFFGIKYESIEFNDNLCSTIFPNLPDNSLVYLIIDDDELKPLIHCVNRKDDTVLVIAGYDSNDGINDNKTHNVFFSTSVVYPRYNYGVLYKPILEELNRKSLESKNNFYNRLMYIYYIMVYVTYTIDTYGETSEDLMNVLYSYKFPVSDNDIYFGYDNQLLVPVQTFLSSNGELRLVKPLSLSFGSIIMTNNYDIDNRIGVCDFTYPASVKNITKILIGAIIFGDKVFVKESINFFSILSMFIDDYNSEETFNFYMELIVKKADNEDLVRESMKYFIDNGIHHVIGGLYEKYNDIILPLCESNKILYWYIGLATKNSSCSPYIIDFSPTSSIVSFLDYIYKSTLNPVVFIYSQSIKDNKIDLIFNNIFDNAINTYIEFSPLSYIEISNVLLKIPNGGSIVLIEEYDDIELTIENLATVIKSFKNSKDYVIYIPYSLYVSNNFNNLPIEVRYISIIDYTYSTSNSIKLRKIYSKYYFKKRPMSIIEESISNMICIFVELVQKYKVNDITSFQEDLIHNTFDTLSGNLKFTSDLTCGSFYNVIEYYQNSTFKNIYTNPQTGISYLDYKYKNIFCNFSEGLNGNVTVVERTDVGFILDDNFEEFHQLYQNIFELAIENINTLGGIGSKQLSYIILRYNGNTTKFILDFKSVNEVSKIHVFFGLIREDVLYLLSELLDSYKSVFYHIRPHWNSDFSSSIYFMYGQIDNYFVPGLYWIMSFTTTAVIVYSEKDVSNNQVNGFTTKLQDTGIFILKIIEIPKDCDDYSSFTYVLVKSLSTDTIIINLLSTKQTNRLIERINEVVITPLTMISFLIDPGLVKIYDSSIVKHYVFNVFNPMDIKLSDNNEVLYNYFKSYSSGNDYPSTGVVLFYESVLLFYHASIESEKNEKSISVNHYEVKVDLPSGSVYLNSENYLEHYIYLLHYNNGKFETFYHSETSHSFYTPSSYTLLSQTQVNQTLIKKRVGIAFVYALSGKLRYQELPLFLASISGYYTIQKELEEYYSLFYTLFDSKSDADLCQSLAADIVNSGKYNFIIGGPYPDCFYKIEELVKDTSVYFFYPSPFCGQSCFRNIIFTGGLPNQYYSNAFSHFSPFFATNQYMYLFYDSTMHCSNVSHSIIRKTIEGTALILVSFDINSTTVLDMINRVDIMEKNNGLILFIDPELNYLLMLLKELYDRKMKRDRYPFLTYYISETQFEEVPIKLREGIYMFGSYFQTEEDDKFKKSVYEYTLYKTVTTRMSSVYIIFLFIRELLNDTPYADEGIKISRIYDKEVETDEGKIKLASNNMLSKKFQLAQYYEDGSLQVIVNYRNPTSPDAYDWFITPNYICDFTNQSIMEKGYQNSNSYMMVVYPQSEEDFQLLGIANSILAPINGNGGINHNRIIFKYTQPPSVSACETYAQMFNDTDAYLALYISAPYQCIKKFLDATKDHPKQINIFSQFDEEICIRDVYTSALYPGVFLSNLFIQLMSADNNMSVLLLHSKAFDSNYMQIHNSIDSLSIHLINDINFEDVNLYELLYEYIRNYTGGFYIVMDNDYENEINKVIYSVNNFTNNNNIDGKIRYISFYNQPSFITTIPYYYIIDSTPHIFTYDKYQVRSPAVSDELYEAYVTVADSIKTNKLTDKIASLYNMFHFWALFNQFQLPLSSPQYYDLIYNLEVDSVEGKVYMQQNNRLMKSLTYSYIDYDGKLFEYVLGPLKAHTWAIYSKNDVVNVSVCSWPDANGEVLLPVFKVGIMYPVTGMYSDSTIYSFSTLLICMASFNIKTSIDLGYYLQPIIKDTFSTDEGIENAFKYFSDEKIRIVFTHIRGSKFNEEEYFDKDTLYFNIGFSFQLFESNNVIDFGLPVTILSYLYYREILKYSYDLFIIVDQSLFSNSLYNDLSLRLSSTSINLNSYLIQNGIDFDKVILSLNATCYSLNSSTCFIIYSIDGDLNLEGMKSIYRNGLLDDNKYIIYTPFIDRNNKNDIGKIYKGVKTIETYIPELNETGYDFITPQYKEFEDFKQSNFPQLNYTFGFMENAFVSFSMLVSTLKKFLSPSNITLLIESISYHQYSTPSGSIYISKDLKAQRRYYEILVEDIYFNYKVVSHTELLSPKTYDTSIYKEEFIENTTSVFALILDYCDKANKRLSHLMLLLFDNYIRDENNQVGVSETKMTYKIIPIRHTNYDITIVDSLIQNEKIQILFGCQSQYSYNLMKSRMIGNTNKLLYSLNYPFYPECESNIVHIKPSLRTVLIPSIEAVQNTSNKYAIIIMSAIEGYENDANDITEFISNYLINNTKIVPINITIVNDNNYKEKFDGIMKLLASDRMKTIIFNMLDYKYLLLFEELYIKNEFSSIHHLQIIYDIEEYLMGYDIITKLTGHFFPRTYSSDRSLPSTINFENYIDIKIGSIEFITETLSTLESSFTIYLASVKQALSLANIDNIINASPTIDYIRRGTQLVDISTSSGNKHGSITNHIESVFEIVEISSAGKAVPIDNKNLRVSLLPEVYFKNDSNCDCGPTTEIFHINQIVIVIIITICVIVSLFLVFEVTVLILFRKYKVIKAASYQFLIYFLVSGVLVIVTSIISSLVATGDLVCMFSQGIFYLCLINYSAILILRTWRIHAVYRNTKMTKQKITNEKVFFRVFMILFLCAFISVVWGLINPFSGYSKTLSKEYSTIIKNVYVQECDKNIYYMLYQGIILTILFTCGIYFSWTTRNTIDEFNDSRSLSTTIGALAILELLYLVIEIVLTTNPEAKFLLENLGICLVVLISSGIFIVPKFYKIYREYKRKQKSRTVSIKQFQPLYKTVSKHNNKIHPFNRNSNKPNQPILLSTRGSNASNRTIDKYRIDEKNINNNNNNNNNNNINNNNNEDEDIKRIDIYASLPEQDNINIENNCINNTDFNEEDDDDEEEE